MKRVMPIHVKFMYLNAPESEKRVQIAYNRIFELAKRNILERKREQRKAIQKK